MSLHAEKILILTPIKDAEAHLDGYFGALRRLDWPPKRISLGFLEGDSADDSYALIQRRLPSLRRRYRRASCWKKDFGYRVPVGLSRHHESIQIERRRVLARSRNHLLFHALDDEDFVLWIDIDVDQYPPDVLSRLIATGKDIVQPHCVLEPGGRSYDLNAWRDQGRLHLDDLRSEGDLVPLDAVGGTMLLVRADLHRDGLVFPPFLYGLPSSVVRAGRGELETEGLGCLAHDMGHACWGMPNLEIRHSSDVYPEYRRMISELKALVGDLLPRGSTALVVSKGDEELLRLDTVSAWHFPQTEEGGYLGYHPAESATAIRELEVLRHRGAQYLVLPATALWWLDHYVELRDHLHTRYRALVAVPDAGQIFDLQDPRP